MRMQVSFLEAFLSLFVVHKSTIIGLIVMLGVLMLVFKKDKSVDKYKVTIATLLLFYYFTITLTNLFGTPSISSIGRVLDLGESFGSNFNFIPFKYGITMSFILNIMVFIPIGFLVPFISSSFKDMKKTVLFGFLLSLTIEISQIFTLHRAVDIDDLIANTSGMLIGYCCLCLFKRAFFKRRNGFDDRLVDYKKYLPISAFIVSFLNIFIFT